VRRDHNHRRGFLISFIGVDGSGKTTLANAVLAALRDRGVKCEYVWGRFGSVLVDRVVAISKRLVFHQKDNRNGTERFLKTKSWVFKNRFTASFYALFVTADYFWQILFKLWVPHICGRNIICDRYVYDAIIDLAVDLGYSTKTYSTLLAGYLRLVPKPDLAFLISVPEQLAYERKDDIPSLEYLRRRKELYDHVAGQYDFVVLDGSLSSEEIRAVAQSMVLEYLGEIKT
jgi:thymidylate kinase